LNYPAADSAFVGTIAPLLLMYFSMRNLIKAALVVFTAFLSLAVPGAAGPIEDAEVAFDLGDYSTALALIRPLAEQGNAKAQLHLGALYSGGLGVPRDDAEAMKWFRKAADQGLAQAQLDLGNIYAQGIVIAQDYTQAVKWLLLAAEQGNAEAQYNLGLIYDPSPGKHSDQIMWRDSSKAAGWYRKAAEQGYASAQYDLGHMYENGQEVVQDYVQAHKWLNLAQSQDKGGPYKNTSLDRVASKMTPAQVAEAQKLAREWKPVNAPAKERKWYQCLFGN
jgi:TPR repeat protein